MVTMNEDREAPVTGDKSVVDLCDNQHVDLPRSKIKVTRDHRNRCQPEQM